AQAGRRQLGPPAFGGRHLGGLDLSQPRRGAADRRRAFDHRRDARRQGRRAAPARRACADRAPHRDRAARDRRGARSPEGFRDMKSEQQVYARWLDWGRRIALVVLIASFLAYALALVDPLLPPQELATLWAFPVDHYIAASGAPTGWGWLPLLPKSDYLVFLAVAMLGLVTVICYARIIP